MRFNKEYPSEGSPENFKFPEEKKDVPSPAPEIEEFSETRVEQSVEKTEKKIPEKENLLEQPEGNNTEIEDSTKAESFNYSKPVEKPVNPEGLLQKLQKDRLEVCVANARHILGPDSSDEEVMALAKRTFAEYIKAIGFSLKPKSRRELIEMTDVDGRNNLDQAINKKGRAIVVTSHMAYFPTAMKMIPELIPERTRGTAIVEKNPVWPLINAWQKAKKMFAGGKAPESKFDMMVKESKNPKTLLNIIDRLKEGSSEGKREILFMAADRGDLSPDRRRTKVDFFGAEVNFPTGPTTLAKHTDSPIIPAYITREGDRFKLTIGEAMELDKGLDEDDAAHDLMQKVADFFAQGIKEHPEQWPVYRHDYWPEQEKYK